MVDIIVMGMLLAIVTLITVVKGAYKSLYFALYLLWLLILDIHKQCDNATIILVTAVALLNILVLYRMEQLVVRLQDTITTIQNLSRSTSHQ